jgi:vacuolar iron transporter family protein
VSISAQNELILRELEVERRELVVNAKAEQAELAAMYRDHGMRDTTADLAAADVMRSPEAALAVHAREEFGIDPHDLPSAMQAAVLSLICFIVGAVLPVIPWFIGQGTAAKIVSIALGVVAAAALGWVIGHLADRNRAFSAARQVAIMLAACTVTYLIGKLLHVNIS